MVIMSRVRALVVASHPGPCLAITVLAAQAAPHGAGPLLTAPAMLAGQISVGWSNDALDSERDAAARRTGKPIAAGLVRKRTVWIAALVSLVAALAGDGRRGGHRARRALRQRAPGPVGRSGRRGPGTAAAGRGPLGQRSRP